MKKLITILAAAALVAAFAFPASAQNVCGPFDQITGGIGNETVGPVAGFGLQKSGRVMMLWVNRDTGAWMLTTSDPNGFTCIVSTGEGWQPTPRPAPGVPS